jgi:hypothetical protein
VSGSFVIEGDMREGRRRAAGERFAGGVSCLALAGMLSIAGCDRASTRRYLATANAIDVGRGMRLCIAVDSRDPHGVWWWQPGVSGCTSRSTGPTVFHADQAAISRSSSPEETIVAFRLGLHARTPTFLDVRLVIRDGRMRLLDSGTEVALQRRPDLDVPSELPRR